MYDGRYAHEPIQGQGHWASEVPKIALLNSRSVYLRHLQWQLAYDHQFFVL